MANQLTQEKRWVVYAWKGSGPDHSTRDYVDEKLICAANKASAITKYHWFTCSVYDNDEYRISIRRI